MSAGNVKQRGAAAPQKFDFDTSTKQNERREPMVSAPTGASDAKGSTSQSYRISFANPRAPSFVFDSDIYSFDWVKDFAAGIASAACKDFELPSCRASEARSRGERMGQSLKIYARRWGIRVDDFRAIRIEWHMIDGTIKTKFYGKLDV